MSLGIEVNVLPAAVDEVRARGGLVVAQVNPRMPYTYGDAELAVDLIDLALEVDEPLAGPAPLAARRRRPAHRGARSRTGCRTAPRSQTGIGAVPDATLAGLTGQRGLRVWTEMFSDGVLGLDRAGALDPAAPLTASFLFGSAELYAWVHRNDRGCGCCAPRSTNDPALIAASTAR